MQTRTYDLTITYDNYYRTPRLWLFGYDEVMYVRARVCVFVCMRGACVCDDIVVMSSFYFR